MIHGTQFSTQTMFKPPIKYIHHRLSLPNRVTLTPCQKSSGLTCRGLFVAPVPPVCALSLCQFHNVLVILALCQGVEALTSRCETASFVLLSQDGFGQGAPWESHVNMRVEPSVIGGKSFGCSQGLCSNPWVTWVVPTSQ